MKCLIKFLALLLAISMPARGTVYNSNGTTGDTQSKIASASTGDTVILTNTGAAYTWTTTVTVSNGVTLNLNSCIITNGNTADALDLTCNGTVGGITRITGGGTNQALALLVQTNNAYQFSTVSGTFSNYQFHIDNVNWLGRTDQNSYILLQVETEWGLIDHCNFAAMQNSEIIHNIAYGPVSSNGWMDVVSPGTSNQVYIEDCTFTNNDPNFSSYPYFLSNSGIQGYYGCRTVLRHCIFYCSQIDMHGGPLGARWWEIYSNTWAYSSYFSSGSQSDSMDLRAGSGVVWSNLAPGSVAASVAATLILATSTVGDSTAFGPPGRGILSGATPTVVPANEWNNDANLPVGGNAGGVSSVLNTDYYNTNLVPYTPYVYPHPLQGQESGGGGGGSTIPIAAVIAGKFTGTWH